LRPEYFGVRRRRSNYVAQLIDEYGEQIGKRPLTVRGPPVLCHDGRFTFDGAQFTG
jgi:hypothetical protein